MKRTIIVTLLLSMFLVTGCWDITEIDSLAIELGWGVDKAPNGKIETSAQVVIPSRMKTQGGGRGQPYFVVSGVGKSTLDATVNMQTRLSRRVLRSHRRVLFIGEPLARQGLKSVMDTYARDPQVRLRTDVFVTQGSSAKDFLEIPYPLETIPAVGAFKEHVALGGLGSLVLLDFLTSSATAGSCPTLPVLREVTDNSRRMFAYAGRAIFNEDLKMVGAVNATEAQLMFWVKGANKYLTVTADVPQGNGNVSVEVIKPQRKIRPEIKNGKLTFRVVLVARGIIRENNTDFDLRNRQNLKVVESALEREATQSVKQVITKVQQKYGTDVFGFGEAVHRKYPYRWKTMKKQWDKEFAKASISVETRMTVKRVGLTGPALQLKESEIKN